MKRVIIVGCSWDRHVYGFSLLKIKMQGQWKSIILTNKKMLQKEMTISSSITYTRQEMCVLMLQHYLPWFSLIIFARASISHFLNFIVESNILYPFYKHHLNESKLLDHRSISKIEKKVYVRTLVSTCNI